MRIVSACGQPALRCAHRGALSVPATLWLGGGGGRFSRLVRTPPVDLFLIDGEFYGIVIAMYYREHGVPHFHATYAGETVVIAIGTGDVIAGSIPARALRLVQEWCELHRDEFATQLGSCA